MLQAELPLGGDAPNARSSDPISSHIANAALRNNKTLADWIVLGVIRLSDRGSEAPRQPVDDNQLWEFIELHTNKRQQRNNIARSRGLLERDGFFVRVPGDRVWVIPSPELLAQFKESQ